MTPGKRLPASRPPGIETPEAPAGDRLRRAGGLVGAATLVILLAAAILVWDGVIGGIRPPSAALTLSRVLMLDTVALTPAGRRERGPVPSRPVIDWRYLPSLPDRDPAVIRLLDEGLQSSEETKRR